MGVFSMHTICKTSLKTEGEEEEDFFQNCLLSKAGEIEIVQNPLLQI